MFIAKDNDLIILAKNTKEELLKNLQFLTYTSIEETDKDYKLYCGQYLTPEEIKVKKREKFDKLTLTPSDVERALYKAKGMDFEDLKALIAEQIPTIDIKALAIEFRAKDFYRGATAIIQDDKTDDNKTISSLQNGDNSELENNETNLATQRPNDLTTCIRLFDVVGALLGYTQDDMDYLFENKELPTQKTID